MSKVVHMADIKNDNRLISPVDMLRLVADEIESGERSICKRVFVVLVDNEPVDGNETFSYEFQMANISTSIALAAIECVKYSLLNIMID